ncbi:hydantoinase/oxoprolinase family protein [Pseudomonas typographi]|uniref:Hydantoinase/oxoprolinase family protein n=1 Tax=Pseudomonas typographi TaxID=2715964 RepID=A0ABR7Z4U7_9PSED|nr:hydantoinase/oxoprolinase family protein [Pseudomonas typographi]MBD1588430.1 hydantoinase/oxoprolinase family protein [Pseudomonas typographi]MBD1600495.1 hydantoinase/oxoprolinase family protein [Pseudomonas typographi]
MNAIADEAIYSFGIDIGGTFTDVILHRGSDGQSISTKVLTTHLDPREGAIIGVRQLLEQWPIPPRQVGRVVHATTLFTNALIERKGVPTALVTTAGFADSLEIGTERKFDLYDINIEKPAPLVPRELRFEVEERLNARGEVVTALSQETLAAVVARLVEQRIESVAVVFLHSYLNPVHERLAAEYIRKHAPGVHVTTSYDVAPEIREYERTSTTTACAFVKPLAEGYLRGLQNNLRELNIGAPMFLMLSNGGLTHLEEVLKNPIQMLESGPAAGALSSAFFGKLDGYPDLLGFDMGGTTAKLCLVEQGAPMLAYAFEAGRTKRFMEGSGLPIKISTVELIEIGAGGGSIARANSLGLLNVGPDSAGSEPGPVCYGRGGDQPTVTDANLQLGYLNPDFFAGGSMQIDAPLAGHAIGRLADQLGLSLVKAASGIHILVSEAMASAARVHIAEHGRDPRHYSLLLTGGGGPVHGYCVGRKLGVKRLICPPSPGVASAWGLLVAPVKIDRVRTLQTTVQDGDLQAVEQSFLELEQEARGVVQESAVQHQKTFVKRLAEGRYKGQGFSLIVPVPDAALGNEQGRQALIEAFENEYRRKFSRAPSNLKIELVAIRLSVHTEDLIEEGLQFPSRSGALAAVKQVRKAWFEETGGYVDTTVYNRDLLGSGDTFNGPALVEDAGSTLVVGPNATCSVTAHGSIIIELH